jgi:hypothetical protein
LGNFRRLFTLSRFLPIGPLFTLSRFVKITEIAHFLFQTKIVFGFILVRVLQKPIRSPWSGAIFPPFDCDEKCCSSPPLFKEMISRGLDTAMETQWEEH